MYRILVVDDDSDFNSAVCSFLTENGYEAKGYLNASDAYDAMYGGVIFDMIISDIIMPGISGFEFAQRYAEPPDKVCRNYRVMIGNLAIVDNALVNVQAVFQKRIYALFVITGKTLPKRN